MNRKIVSWLFACLFTIFASAQDKFQVMGKAPDVYVEHVAREGETLQSISNQFSQSPAKLASYNNLNPVAPVSKNTRIRIPLTKDNLLKDKNGNSRAVYSIVSSGDNLSRLSALYNKPVALLKEWNNMTNEVVKEGQAVIIGFIVYHPSVEEKRAAKIKSEQATADSLLAATGQDKKPNLSSAIAPGEIKKETHTDNAQKNSDEGYFAVSYTQHTDNQLKQFHSGDAAVFKTISGWTDRKYYVLMNEVAAGTIVRITSSANKAVFAKVLGPLQEPAGVNNGLLLRMSNAAAVALGMTEAKFTVTVSYFE